MNRRNFLKALTAITGSAAITPSFANALPEQIPGDTDVSIGYMVDGRFNRWQTIKVESFSGPNTQAIVFPECTRGYAYITHVEVAGVPLPLAQKFVISAGVVPMFQVGSLTITEE